jgi:hypothetical protein
LPESGDLHITRDQTETAAPARHRAIRRKINLDQVARRSVNAFAARRLSNHLIEFGDLLFKMPAVIDCPDRQCNHFGDGGFASFPSRHDTATNAKQLCGPFLGMAESLSPSLESLCVH